MSRVDVERAVAASVLDALMRRSTASEYVIEIITAHHDGEVSSRWLEGFLMGLSDKHYPHDDKSDLFRGWAHGVRTRRYLEASGRWG
jgi:hypothetical protein